ncbi:uncharacterized protein FRV6_09162 [Fusarium oxysporum]|uniref:Uncharacterized protein n=1 Tax=Fusarium oxysporum TaxID=5507 RepID=A0A2H3TBJ0_FUSOX|nr:uncharacterized protein FRV6_09162 [Fusarium oxysporum]
MLVRGRPLFILSARLEK